MGDTDTPTSENTNETPQSESCDVPKPSIDILKEVRPSENLAVIDKIESSHSINVETTLEASTGSEENKTVELKNKVVAENVHIERKTVEKLKEKVEPKNKSDIFGVNANSNLMPATIFSVGGAPSKTIHKTTSKNSDKTSSSSDTIRSNVSRQSHYRNPLTGIGVSSKDEFKNKPTKRKDGNPLLGVGYKDDHDFFNTPPPTRIPPGGYSKGLW